MELKKGPTPSCLYYPRRNQMKISVLIPAYNEEQNIEETIEGVRELTGNTGGNEKAKIDIIVIDDGSTDNTYARASKKAAF